MAQGKTVPVVPGEERSRRSVLVAMGALLFGMLLAALDQTIVATALPTIVSELGGVEHLSWVVTAYLLASTAATPVWGKIGDMYGRKKVFQAAIVIFLIGSALCGVAQDMPQLILFRALQGLGGGGLMVLSVAIVGDLVPPRERGRYQGLFGSVFGVASVLGPLLGGLFVDHLNWRWVFYVNLPLGVVALLVIAAVLHIPVRRTPHRIDYPGIVVIASLATCVVLVTSLGGVTWDWTSWQIIGLGLLAVVLLPAFVLIERRAAEPVLPLHLFGNQVFLVCSVVGFIVGFALFGAMTYLPLFLQVVRGVSPTLSGIHMLPMVLGTLIASIGCGQLVSRTGRYKVFPILGTAFTAIGLFLMGQLSETTGDLVMSFHLFVFGIGIGLVLPIMILAVQNAVGYENLGVATSGTTFFRSVGASIGVAVFGSVFAHRLRGHLADALADRRLPPGFDASVLEADPRGVAGLPPSLMRPALHAYSQSITDVFLWAVPVIVVAFFCSWFLKEIPVRSTVTAPDMSETVGVNPVERSSLEEIARCLSVLGSRQARRDLYLRITALAGLDLQPASSWLLMRLQKEHSADPVELAEKVAVPRDIIERAAVEIEERHLAVREGNPLVLTDQGRALAVRLVEARRTVLQELLGDWDPARHAELEELLHRLSTELSGGDEDRPGRPAR